MATCVFCLGDMRTAVSCTVAALHRNDRYIAMIPFGSERGQHVKSTRCGDCGVVPGGWHHLGCDRQVCPLCDGQMLSCGCRFDEDRRADDDDEEDDDDDDDDDDIHFCTTEFDGPTVPLGVDANGAPTERATIGGVDVIIHRADVPESDVTTVRGIRCTTALRTIIDLGAEQEPDDVVRMLRNALGRRLFTLEEAHRRVGQPDLATHRGAEVVRQLLRELT